MSNSTDFAGKYAIVSSHAVGQARARGNGLAGKETPEMLSLIDNLIGENWTGRWDILDQGGERQLVSWGKRGCYAICKANARYMEDSRPVVLTILTQSMVDKNLSDGRYKIVLKHQRQIGDQALTREARRPKYTVLWNDSSGRAKAQTIKHPEGAEKLADLARARGGTDVEIKQHC